MSKTTKKQQLELLLTMMESHPDIARGFYKSSKEDLARFWRKAELELNIIGPPMKNVTEWKKVWSDQKKYVRQKAAQNLKMQKGTGGGPNTQRILSDFEETIYNLIGMKESVEGVPAKTFGLCAAPVCTEQMSLNEFSFDDDDDVIEDFSLYAVENKEAGYTKPPVLKKAVNRQNKKPLSSALLEEELLIQKELCGTIKTAVDDLKENCQSSKKIYRSLDRLCELHKGHFNKKEALKEREVEEIVRHSLNMEKLKLREVESKIEKNHRLIELEELKCNEYN